MKRSQLYTLSLCVSAEGDCQSPKRSPVRSWPRVEGEVQSRAEPVPCLPLSLGASPALGMGSQGYLEHMETWKRLGVRGSPAGPALPWPTRSAPVSSCLQ